MNEEKKQALENLKQACLSAYSSDLCHPAAAPNWTPENPTYGMCGITALVVNDYYGGEIDKVQVEAGWHYFNVIDGEVVDFTSAQFGREIDYAGRVPVSREEVLSDGDKRPRYEALKARVEGLKS